MKIPKAAYPVTPERSCELTNELVRFVGKDGNPTKMTPEPAARVLQHPEFLKHLLPLPPNTIIGGFDS